jgi:GT2 family glycosyltransferase
VRLAVLVTCFNRKEISVKNLKQLDGCLNALDSLNHSMFIVDDGSTDGTGEALKQALPSALIVKGNGNLYWNGGMCKAYESARTYGGRFDAYLMFNDDVFVLPNSLAIFFQEYVQINKKSDTILAAATESEIDQKITYSGKKLKHSYRPLALVTVPPNGSLQTCDTFNGNFVMLPGKFFERVGGNDPKYVHAYGDIDLGLVAKKLGVATFLASTAIGYCEANTNFSENTKRSNPFLSRINRFFFGSWGITNDGIDQRLHYIFKHSEPPIVFLHAAKSVVQFYLNEFRNEVIKKLGS